MKFGILESAEGSVALLSRKNYLSSLDLFPNGCEAAREWVARRFPEAVESPDHFTHAMSLLRRYLQGEPVELDFPVDLEGLGRFTVKVLEETRRVPYGKTASFGSIARRIGYTGAARAVGQALHRNPIPLVIPCHRIIKGDGSLGGFGMGLDLKAGLLAREGVSVADLRATMIS
jgi:methylated-DNA-[protein]-cysteine S-methyltransferase